jgi:hypothetical protein
MDFYSWLGETLSFHYGRSFKEHGFDSLEVLAQLNDHQISQMLTHYIPIEKVGHRFHFENRLAALRQDFRPSVVTRSPSLNHAATTTTPRRPRATKETHKAESQTMNHRNARHGGVPVDFEHEFRAPTDDDAGVRARSSSALESVGAAAPHDVMTHQPKPKALKKSFRPPVGGKPEVRQKNLAPHTPEPKPRTPFVSPPSPPANAGRDANAESDKTGAYDKLIAILHAAPALNAARKGNTDEKNSSYFQ